MLLIGILISEILFYHMFDVDSFSNCMLNRKTTTGIIDVMVIIMLTTCSYTLYNTSNVIYQFSKHGLLPRNEQKRLFWILLIVKFAIVVAVAAVYISLNYVFVAAENWNAVTINGESFESFRVFSHFLALLEFSFALHRTRNSIINSDDKGILLMSPLVIMILTLIVLIYFEVAEFFVDPTDVGRLVTNDIGFETMYVIVNITTFIIIQSMVVDFTFSTVVTSSNQIYIVGLDRQKKELFRFKMREDMKDMQQEPITKQAESALLAPANTVRAAATSVFKKGKTMIGISSEPMINEEFDMR